MLPTVGRRGEENHDARRSAATKLRGGSSSTRTSLVYTATFGSLRRLILTKRYICFRAVTKCGCLTTPCFSIISCRCISVCTYCVVFVVVFFRTAAYRTTKINGAEMDISTDMRGDSTDGTTAMSDGMFGKRIGLAVALCVCAFARGRARSRV